MHSTKRKGKLLTAPMITLAKEDNTKKTHFQDKSVPFKICQLNNIPRFTFYNNRVDLKSDLDISISVTVKYLPQWSCTSQHQKEDPGVASASNLSLTTFLSWLLLYPTIILGRQIGERRDQEKIFLSASTTSTQDNHVLKMQLLCTPFTSINSLTHHFIFSCANSLRGGLGTALPLREVDSVWQVFLASWLACLPNANPQPIIKQQEHDAKSCLNYHGVIIRNFLGTAHASKEADKLAIAYWVITCPVGD